MIKKAMIMAAGVGSRLGALSNVLPKPLVPLANIPAMDIIIKNLNYFGIKDIIANTYYMSEVIQNYYKNNNSGVNINFVKESELSGTAGGVKKCQYFFDKGEDFIVMSGDGLSDIDMNKAYESHKNSNAIATIVLKEVDKRQVDIYGIVVRDEKGYVKSFQEKPKIEDAKSNLANTGIYIFNHKIFDYIPENKFYDFAKNVFPSLMENGENINTYKHEGYWSDVGSIYQYIQSNFDILDGKIKGICIPSVMTKNGKYTHGSNFTVQTDSAVTGNCIFGNNCKIGANSKIINSILWNNVTIGDNVTVKDCIILDNIKIEKSISSEIAESSIIREKENIMI